MKTCWKNQEIFKRKKNENQQKKLSYINKRKMQLKANKRKTLKYQFYMKPSLL